MKAKLQLLFYIAPLFFLTACKKEVGQSLSVPPPIHLPTVTTAAVSDILTATAGSGGTVTADNDVNIIAQGVCWSTDSIPKLTDAHTTDSIGKTTFTSALTGLAPGTIYFVSAYASTPNGTVYGKPLRFSTCALDLDNNIYHTVIIGTQLWMVENLRTTHYRSGDPITKIIDNANWVTASSSYGAYCTYNYDETNALVYGRLYNYPVITDTRNVCPTGWRLPNNNDWQTLTLYLGGITVAGGAMKESGNSHWATPNTGATNSSGFTAVPGGNCGYGGFADLGNACYFWSDPSEQYTRALLRDHADIAGTGNGPSVLGLSIRCIKD